MMRALLFLWLVMTAGRLPAQQKETDSLLAVLSLHPEGDTMRLDILNDLAFYYNSFDPDKGLIFASQAIKLAQKTGNKIKLAAAYSGKGVNYYAKGADSLSLSMYSQALHIHEQLNNVTGMARAYNNMAMVYVDRSDYAKALDCHQKALQILKQNGDSIRVAASLTNTGVVYLRMADYPKALEYYLQALAIYENLNNKDVIANTLTNIGIVYKNLQKYPDALQYQERALKLFSSSGNLQGKANCLANSGVVYDLLNDSAKAMDLYMQALAINESIGNNRRVASDLTNIGIIYRNRGNWSKAMELFAKALGLYEKTEDKNSLSILLSEIGIAYIKAPAADLKKYQITTANRYAKSLAIQERSLKLATEIGAVDRQAESWAHLSETYEAKHDFAQALHAYKQYTILQDSILNDTKTKEITRREIQFGFEKEQALRQARYDKKQALSIAEIKRQRTIKGFLAAGLAGLLLAAVGIFVFYKKSRDAEASRKEAEFNTHVRETEMKVMRLQMNPHFIFNSLNAISDYISRHDTRSADNYLSKFAKVMRMTLENSEQKEVPLAEDLKALELYMQLESLRLPYPFTYEIEVDDSIDADNTLVPPLLLQPFVENSIWHGLSKKPGAGKIIIRIKAEEGMISCSIEDNGTGRKPAGNENMAKRSLGMKITSARIDIINRTRKVNGTVKVSDLEEGTKVQIRLPLELSI